jgi:hypothetical protein
VQALVETTTCSSEPAPDSSRVEAPFAHLMAAYRSDPHVRSQPSLMNRLRKKLNSVTLQLPAPHPPAAAAAAPRSTLLDAAPHLSAQHLVSHAMQSSLTNQAVASLAFLVKPPVRCVLGSPRTRTLSRRKGKSRFWVWYGATENGP